MLNHSIIDGTFLCVIEEHPVLKHLVSQKSLFLFLLSAPDTTVGAAAQYLPGQTLLATVRGTTTATRLHAVRGVL